MVFSNQTLIAGALCAGFFFITVVVVIIFLYGDDIYRRSSKVKELLKINREKRKDADICIFDLEEDKNNWRIVKEFLEQPSMFSLTKTAVIYESGAADIKEWRELLKKEINTTDHVLIISDQNSPKKNFLFLLCDGVKSTEYKELEGKALEVFLKRELDVQGVNFENDAWREFVSHISLFPQKTAAGVQEIGRLSLLFGGKNITIKDLFSVVQKTQNEDVFGIAKKIIFERNVAERMALLERAFLHGVDAGHLFNSLAILARGNEAEKLADLDVRVKSGNGDYEEVLLDFVLTK